jgi:sugar lactone lactonase YvrE
VGESSKTKPGEIFQRLKSASSPAAAVAGAFVSFAGAALGKPSKPPIQGSADMPLVRLSAASSKALPASMKLEVEYSTPIVLRGTFRQSLSGIAVGPNDRIFVLGDGEVRIFERDGREVRNWKAPNGASCIAVSDEARVYFGAAGRVEIYDIEGSHKAGFDASEPGKPADITAIRVRLREILVADAAVRYVRRYGYDGKHLGAVGTQTKTGGFMLPNHSLDIDVDSKGVLIAADSGRHRVSSWTLDGTPIRQFGKFGLLNPGDFVGCCNPVNIALTPDGKIVTAEKVIPRIKVYNTEGKLLALIGPEHFDSKCTRLHLAIDSQGRILVADPIRLEVKIFPVAAKSGGHERA